MNKLAEDKALAERANLMIASGIYVSRTAVARALGVSRERLNRLDRLGMIKSYPAPLNNSQAATLGRKVSPWGTKFRLRGSPDFGGTML
jgi:hypothetical protein